jgi:hypothetical protein
MEGASPTQVDVFVEVDYMPVPEANPWFSDFFPSMRSYHTQQYDHDIIAEMEYSFSHHGNSKIHIDVDTQIPYSEYLTCTGDYGSDTKNVSELSHFLPSPDLVFTGGLYSVIMQDMKI